MNEFILVLGMMLVTFGVRYPVLAVVGRLNLPPAVLRALQYVPAAVLTAIIVPAVLIQEGTVNFSPQNAALVGAIIATGIAWYTKSLLWTILIGMAVFLFWRAFIG